MSLYCRCPANVRWISQRIMSKHCVSKFFESLSGQRQEMFLNNFKKLSNSEENSLAAVLLWRRSVPYFCHSVTQRNSGKQTEWGARLLPQKCTAVCVSETQLIRQLLCLLQWETWRLVQIWPQQILLIYNFNRELANLHLPKVTLDYLHYICFRLFLVGMFFFYSYPGNQMQTVSNFWWFNFWFFDLTTVWEWYTLSRNHISNFEFGSSLGPAICSTVLSLDAGHPAMPAPSQPHGHEGKRQTYWPPFCPTQPFCFHFQCRVQQTTGDSQCLTIKQALCEMKLPNRRLVCRCSEHI